MTVGFHLLVYRALLAAFRRDLQESDLVHPFGRYFEEMLEGLHALDDALGIIEPVDAEQQLAAAETIRMSWMNGDCAAVRAARA